MKYPITLANRSVKGNISITKLKEKKRKRYSKNSLIKIATKSRSEKFRKKYRWQSKNKWRRKARVKERCKRKRGEEGKWVAMNYACQESKRGRARNIDRRNAALCVCGARDIAKILATMHAQRERERILSNHVFLDDNCIVRTQLIINEESKNPTKKNYNSSNFSLSNSTFVRQRDGLGLSPFIRILLRNDS